MGAFVQQSLDDVDVHLVAIPANCTVAVDVPVTIYEVIHIAAIPLVTHNHILKIEFSLLRKVTQTIPPLHPFGSKVG